MGVPRPTAIMLRTSGDKESMGGDPDPTNTVLQETHEEELLLENSFPRESEA